MAKDDVLTQLQQFREIIRPQEPMAGHTLLKIGGPAEAMIEPRTLAELRRVVKTCIDRQAAVPRPGGRLQHSRS